MQQSLRLSPGGCQPPSPPTCLSCSLQALHAAAASQGLVSLATPAAPLKRCWGQASESFLDMAMPSTAAAAAAVGGLPVKELPKLAVWVQPQPLLPPLDPQQPVRV
jgi:hypothetical protein